MDIAAFVVARRASRVFGGDGVLYIGIWAVVADALYFVT